MPPPDSASALVSTSVSPAVRRAPYRCGLCGAADVLHCGCLELPPAVLAARVRAKEDAAKGLKLSRGGRR